MNNPLSDGNESFTDIFVLGRSEPETLELIEQLEHHDYRVTLFNDGPQLIDTLRSGKPNLIICDSTSFGQEAYEYCRQIKSEDYLWMIPVLVLTRASSLADLLHVLDSNGDNFIAKPCDSPYLLSLIEGMLQTPVEQQTQEQIKTQFKIQHDGKIFVVTADRRKLLEFLLSAFEIAVKNSEDLSSAHAELQALSSRLTLLEDAGLENTQVIGMLRESIRKKEEDERTLTGDLDEAEQALDEKTAEAGQLVRDLGEARTLLTAAEEHVRLLMEEKEKTALAHESEISLLAGQVSTLSQEIRAKTAELDAETAASALLNLAVKESGAKSEQLKTSLQALTSEHEQLASALSAEKERAQSAEDGAKSVLQAKAQSEKDLTRIVDEQRDAARHQSDEILRLKTELEAESGRCRSAETQRETLRHEYEQLKATHEVCEESQKRQVDELQAGHDAALSTIFAQERELKILKDELVVAHAHREQSAASLAAATAAFNETRVGIEEREWKIQSLEKQIADAGILQEKSNEKVRALTASLERLQSALDAEKEQLAVREEQLQAVIRERDETLQSVLGAHDQTKTDLDGHKDDLQRLTRDLETAALLRSTLQGDITAASSRIKELEHELKSAVQAQVQAGGQARQLAEEQEAMKATLSEARSALAREKEERAALDDRLDAVIRERDETLHTVRGAHDQTKTDLDVHRSDLQRLTRDLEAANQLNADLLADVNSAAARINELEHELNSVIRGKEQTGQAARSLSDDLEGTKAELETERRIRRTAEVNLQRSAQEKSRLEGDIARFTAEREQLRAALEQEKVLHTAAEDKVRAATRAKEHAEHEYKAVQEVRGRDDDLHAAEVRKLSQDFQQALARQQVLEQEVTTLESAKAAAEARVDALSDEIEQARTALADEWEDHMNDEERLAATRMKAEQLERSLSAADTAAPERTSAVMVKPSALPAEIRPAPQAVVVTDPPGVPAVPVPPATSPAVPPSFGIEDLFEDVETGPAAAEERAEAPARPPAVPAAEPPGINTSEHPGGEAVPAGEREEDKQAEDREAAGDTVQTLDDFVATPSGYGISFDRRQWLDLLKWSHHSGALSQEQRMQIVRMGRLIQNGRKLTKKQDEQVREMMVLVQTLGYRFH